MTYPDPVEAARARSMSKQFNQKYAPTFTGNGPRCDFCGRRAWSSQDYGQVRYYYCKDRDLHGTCKRTSP